MRYCCQLIPLQITPPFIVSSLSLSSYPSASFSLRSSHSLAFPSRFATPMLFSSLFLEPRLQTVLPISLILCIPLFSALSLSSPFSFPIFLESFPSALCVVPLSPSSIPLSLPFCRCSPLRCPLVTQRAFLRPKDAPGIAAIKEIVPISTPPPIIARSIVRGWLKGAALMHSRARTRSGYG